MLSLGVIQHIGVSSNLVLASWRCCVHFGIENRELANIPSEQLDKQESLVITLACLVPPTIFKIHILEQMIDNIGYITKFR